MNRRIGFFSLFGALLALAFSVGPAQAQALTPERAWGMFDATLYGFYGSTYEKADSKWTACPTVYPSYNGYPPTAICMSEFRNGRTVRFMSGSVDANLSVEIYSTAKWTRKWRRCNGGYLRRISLHGVLWTNDGRCSTATLMASDLAGYVRIGKPRLMRRVGWHGTNLIGFGRIAAYRCVRKRHGNLYNVRCRNSLGDAFRLRMRVKRSSY